MAPASTTPFLPCPTPAPDGQCVAFFGVVVQSPGVAPRADQAVFNDDDDNDGDDDDDGPEGAGGGGRPHRAGCDRHLSLLSFSAVPSGEHGDELSFFSKNSLYSNLSPFQYFDLYNQLEKLPDSIKKLDLQSSSEFGNRLKETSGNEEEAAVVVVAVPKANKDVESYDGGKEQQRLEEEEEDRPLDTAATSRVQSGELSSSKKVIARTGNGKRKEADNGRKDAAVRMNEVEVDDDGARLQGSKISVVRVLPPDGFGGGAARLKRRLGSAFGGGGSAALKPAGDMRDRVRQVLKQEERSRRQLAKQFAPKVCTTYYIAHPGSSKCALNISFLQIFSSLIEPSLPTPPSHEKKSPHPESAERRQFFGAGFVPFDPVPPPPPPRSVVRPSPSLDRNNPYLGAPGVDFPAYDSIPPTGFACPGLPAGYYADPDTSCQVIDSIIA